jgi:hypothetical protein
MDKVNAIKLIGLGLYAAIVFFAVARVVVWYVVECKWKKNCPPGRGFKIRKCDENGPA